MALSSILKTNAEGAFVLSTVAKADIARIDIADVDLVLTTKSGDRYIIPNGGIDAMGATPPKLVLADAELPVSQLLSEVGVTQDVASIDAVPTSEQLAQMQEQAEKKEENEKELKEKLENLQKELQEAKTEAEKQAEEAKQAKEEQQEHDKNADSQSLTTNTETSVEKLVEEAKKIQENLHRSDKDYADPTHFTPPAAPFAATPGVPPPISLTPFVSISMGNVVGTTVSGNNIYGGAARLDLNPQLISGRATGCNFQPQRLPGPPAMTSFTRTALWSEIQIPRSTEATTLRKSF